MWTHFRRYDKFLGVVMGILVLDMILFHMILAGPFIVLIFLTMLTSVPLYHVLTILPALAALLIPARILDRVLLHHLFPRHWATGVGSICLMLTVSALFAMTDNAKQLAAIEALTEGDFDSMSRPIEAMDIAIVRESEFQGWNCTSFCQRLLLTGQATSVLTANRTDLLLGTPDFSRPAMRWRFESGENCATEVSTLAAPDYSVEGETSSAGFPINPANLIKLGTTMGRCLVKSKAKLSDADLVILDGYAAKQAAEPSFNSGINLVSAPRRSIWIKTGVGMIEKARWTHVSATRHPWFAVPSYGQRGRWEDLRVGIGFWRVPVPGLASQPDFAKFTQETLDLRVRLTGAELPALPDGSDPLLAVLKASGAHSEQLQELARNRLSALSLDAPTSRQARELLFLVVADRRVALTYEVAKAAERLKGKQPLDWSETIAEAGFERLHAELAAVPDTTGLSGKRKTEAEAVVGGLESGLSSLSGILATLPESVLRPRMDEIIGLAEDPKSRERVLPLFKRLPEFGEPGARALVTLLTAATELPKDYRHRPEMMYGTAISSLCRMGPKAQVVLPDVLDLMKVAGPRLGINSDHRAIALLVALGHPEAQIRDLFLPVFDPPRPETLVEARRDFERFCYKW